PPARGLRPAGGAAGAGRRHLRNRRGALAPGAGGGRRARGRAALALHGARLRAGGGARGRPRRPAARGRVGAARAPLPARAAAPRLAGVHGGVCDPVTASALPLLSKTTGTPVEFATRPCFGVSSGVVSFCDPSPFLRSMCRRVSGERPGGSVPMPEIVTWVAGTTSRKSSAGLPGSVVTSWPLASLTPFSSTTSATLPGPV